jgi:hypothetical protein
LAKFARLMLDAICSATDAMLFVILYPLRHI